MKTAFLHGDLEETIYMRQLPGFEVKGKEHMAYLLKKSLYGLKQSPRQWYKRFDSFMIKIGFSKNKYDSCLYFSSNNVDSAIYLLLYVHDILIACRHKAKIDDLKSLLKSEFDMKDLGVASKILGMSISRDRSDCSLFLSQKPFLQKIVSKFQCTCVNPS